MINILYFAQISEQLKLAQEHIDLPAEVHTLAELIQHLSTRGQMWTQVFNGQQRLMMAVNQTMAKPETPLHDHDEIAFFPPVTGG